MDPTPGPGGTSKGAGYGAWKARPTGAPDRSCEGESPSCGPRADVQEARRARPFRERKADAPGPSRVGRERAAKRATKPGSRPALRRFAPGRTRSRCEPMVPLARGHSAGKPGHGEVAGRASPQGLARLARRGFLQREERALSREREGRVPRRRGWSRGGGCPDGKLPSGILSARCGVAKAGSRAISRGREVAGTPPARRSEATVRSAGSDHSLRVRGRCPRAGRLGRSVLGCGGGAVQVVTGRREGRARRPGASCQASPARDLPARAGNPSPGERGMAGRATPVQGSGPTPLNARRPLLCASSDRATGLLGLCPQRTSGRCAERGAGRGRGVRP